jgi:hypothetical protein
VCAAFLRSEYYQRIRLPLQRLPFSGMFHSSSILRSFPLRAETTVDLSGSSMLPFPNVPCSQTPPQSPVTIASCGDLLLPSSHYDAVGLRVTIITRLNRFTCVTARSSLVPTLNSCRCLHEPKARFPVGRLVPLSEAGISPAGSIRLFLTHRSVEEGSVEPRTSLGDAPESRRYEGQGLSFERIPMPSRDHLQLERC